MSFPRYPEYKNNGVEWLGEVPTSWRTNKIKFSTYVKGRVGWHGLNSNEFSDVGVHLVTGTDFENGFVSWDRCYRISEQRYIEDPYIQLRENDLLITKDGTIGKLARVKGLPEQATLNSGIFLVRAKDGTYLEDFLYWILQSSLFSHFMDLHKVGSTIQHLYQEVFNQFAFPIPSESEQQLICAFLDRETAKIDALIAEQQRLIELLKEKRQAVISHAVTKGLNPNAPMKDSDIEWLGEVPEHWVIGAVKYFVTVLDGRRIPLSSEERSYKSGDFPYYGASGIIDLIDEYIFDEDLILVSEDGANLVNRATPIAFVAHGRYWVNNHAHILKPIDKHLDYWAQRIEVIDLIPFITGSAQPKLTIQALANLPIAVPSSEEERTEIERFIVRQAEQAEILIQESKTAITLLQERRTALISAAVTGKIDVRGLVALA